VCVVRAGGGRGRDWRGCLGRIRRSWADQSIGGGGGSGGGGRSAAGGPRASKAQARATREAAAAASTSTPSPSTVHRARRTAPPSMDSTVAAGWLSGCRGGGGGRGGDSAVSGRALRQGWDARRLEQGQVWSDGRQAGGLHCALRARLGLRPLFGVHVSRMQGSNRPIQGVRDLVASPCSNVISSKIAAALRNSQEQVNHVRLRPAPFNLNG
jgi:hypothetical protein